MVIDNREGFFWDDFCVGLGSLDGTVTLHLHQRTESEIKKKH